MFKMRYGIPNVYILDIIIYKLHVSLKSNPYKCLNSPLRGLQIFEAPRISRQSAYECDIIFSSTHRPPLTPKETPLVLISVGDFVDPSVVVRKEGLSK